MKKSFLILSLALFLSAAAHAQAAAVMKVSVQIISGVKTEKTSDLYISNNSLSNHDGEVLISTAPLSDMYIFVDESSILKNKDGQILEVKTDSLITTDLKSGKHSISLSSSLPANQSYKGQYSGSVTTTIIYL
jgi:hypothetical protein